MTKAASSKTATAAAAPARRYCRACVQDLSGLTCARCPECGRGFDPADPSTTLPTPVPEWRRSLILKHGVRLATVLLVIVGFYYTAFPRPADWSAWRLLPNDWRLWVWFGRPIGVMHIRTDGTKINADPWLNGPLDLAPFLSPDHDVYAYVWFGNETRREAYRADIGTLAWRIEDLGANRYRMRVLEPGIRLEALLAGFNSIKGNGRFFGVRVGPPDRRVSAGPFSADGSEAAVFSSLVRHYGVRITPFRLTSDQTYVWTWDHVAGSMAPADIIPETAEDYPLDDSDPRRVLIPKPE